VSRLLVFGATSLVGSHFVRHTHHTLEAAGRRDPRERGLPVDRFDPVELSRAPEIDRRIRESAAEAVVNFAGFTDVEAAEQERARPGAAPSGSAFGLNALAPEAMARAARESRKRFLHLSTDFVFDGTSGPYPETADPAPLSPRVGWYGWTKGEGERRARAAHPDTAILRIAYPYRAVWEGKTDFARSWLAKFRAGSLPPLFVDQRLTPTWIPDASRAVEHILRTGGTGVFHAASPSATTPYEFGSELLSAAAGHPVELARGSMQEFLQRPGATPRPLRGGLTVDRLVREGVPLTDWRSGIRSLLDGKEAP
jgi:dTDP-4-dehydrorhamnose reductase